MTNDVKQEILKAHIYGRTAEDIAAIMCVDITEVTALLAISADEIAEKRAYIEQNTPSIKAMTALKDSTGTHYGIDISVWNGAVEKGLDNSRRVRAYHWRALRRGVISNE